MLREKVKCKTFQEKKLRWFGNVEKRDESKQNRNVRNRMKEEDR